MLAAVFSVAEGALNLSDRIKKALRGVKPDIVIKTAIKCLQNKLSDEERVNSEELPIDYDLYSIKKAIREDIVANAWKATPNAFAELAKRDWGITGERAQELSKTFKHCLEIALVRTAPDAYSAIVIADRLGKIEDLLGQALKRPSHLSIPSHEHDVLRLLRDYVGEKYPFVGRENPLEELTSLALFLDKPRVGFVLAEAGRGKTALLAHLYFELTQRHDDKVETVFIPISYRYRLSSKKAFFERLYTELSEITSQNSPPAGTDPEALREFAFGLLEEAAKTLTGENRRLVIIIDALDEATDFELDDIAFPPLPENIRDQVRFILSARPTPHRPIPRSWLKPLGFSQEYATTPELPKLSFEDVCEALEQARESLPPLNDVALEDVATELYRLTDKGDPLLLSFYLESLNENNSTIPKLTPEELTNINPGLEGFFDTWLLALEQRFKGEANPYTLQRLTVDLFTLLANAKDALERDELLALMRTLAEARGQPFHPHEIYRSLDHAGRFLIGPPYALQHPRLNAYFIEKYGEADPYYCQAFLTWGEKALKAASENGTAMPGYLLRQLSAHLAEKGEIDRLGELVVSPTWHWTSTRADLSRSLLANDLDRFLQAGVAPKYAPHWVSDVFYRNRLRFDAEKIPPKYFGALTALGKAEESLAWVRLIRNPHKKKMAIEAVASSLDTGNVTLLDQLWRYAANIEEFAPRADALTAVAQAFAPSNPNRAVEVALEIDRPRERAKALAAVAQALAPSNPNRAVEVALEIDRPRERAKALAAVAQAFAPSNPNRAVEVALEIDRPRERVVALAAVAQALASSNLDRAAEVADLALEIAWEIEGLEERANALATLAQALAPSNPNRAAEVADRAVEVAQEIDEPWWRANVLANIVTILAPNNPDRAAEIALEIDGPRERAKALTAVAQAFAPSNPNRAVEIALEIDGPRERAKALAVVVQALAPSNPNRAAEVADQAVGVAQEIEEPWWRADVLATLAKAFASSNPNRAAEVADRAVEAAQEIEELEERADVLATIAQALASSNPDRAVEIADYAVKVVREIIELEKRVKVFTFITKTLVPIDLDTSLSALLNARKVAEGAGMTWNWIEVAFPALATVDPNLANYAYSRLEKILELLEQPLQAYV